jgi:hypothetical protein
MKSLVASPDTDRAAAWRPDARSLDAVAVTIDLHGIDGVERAVVDHVLALAAAANASPVLAEVFGDDSEPAPVRERAFGKLAMQIGTGAPHVGFTLAA